MSRTRAQKSRSTEGRKAASRSKGRKAVDIGKATTERVTENLTVATAVPSTPVVPADFARIALTDEQRAIVTETGRHVMVEAGAGSGKTATLIEKILYETGNSDLGAPVSPISISQVGAITFTRKAAGEVTERLRQAFLRRASSATGVERERWAQEAMRLDEALLGTIDSFAGALIRDYGALEGVEAGFTLLDEADAVALQQEIAESAVLAAVDAGDPGALRLVRQFGLLKARSVTAEFLAQSVLLVDILERHAAGELEWSSLATEEHPLTTVDYLIAPHADDVLAFAARAYSAYKARLTTDGVLDHAHVLLRATELAASPAVQHAVRDRLRLLFVDEYQDTNALQARLFFRLAGLQDNGSETNIPMDTSAAVTAESPLRPRLRLILIGDPKQSIYSFRQADITVWHRTRRHFERLGGAYQTLTMNHRSRPELTDFFDAMLGPVLDHRVDGLEPRFEAHYRPLASKRPASAGSAVEILDAEEDGPKASARAVAARISAMLAEPDRYPVAVRGPGGEEVQRPLRAGDIAILLRTVRGPASMYEEALREFGLEAYVYGGRGLFQRDEIQDLAVLLRTIVDPHDGHTLVAWLRGPLGGVDDVTLTCLAGHARSQGTSLFDALLDAEHIVSDPAGRSRAVSAALYMRELRELRERLPHHHLLEAAIERRQFRAYLAGAPDAPSGLRNIEKLLRIARHAAHEPLTQFVGRLATKVRRADREDEAPIYAPDDNLITISSIHKAKGLEWPVVVVGGLGESAMRKPYRNAPMLSPRLGVVLPLDVVVTDGESASPVTATSNIWAQHQADVVRRQYAEEKRVFYVAATRARDRLILAGHFRNGRDFRYSAKKLASGKIDFLHLDAPERWVRHALPSLEKAAPGISSLAYGDGQSATVRRGYAACREGVPTEDLALHSTGRGWLDLPKSGLPAPLATTPELPADLRDRTGRALTDRVTPVKSEFTASELLKYSQCAWKHYWGYRASISVTSVEFTHREAVVQQILPALRGEILHRFFEQHDPSWTEEDMMSHMVASILHFRPMPDADARRNAEPLLVHARNYLSSDWYLRVQQAKRVAREEPFLLQFSDEDAVPRMDGSGFRLRGVFDLVLDEANGESTIIDFKTGTFRGMSEEAARQACAERRDEYMVQAAIYALAFYATRAATMPRRFVFFFTAIGHAEVVDIDAAFLEAWRPRIRALVDEIRAGSAAGPAGWDEQRCRNCELMSICRPDGAPLELLRAGGRTDIEALDD